MPEVQFKRLRHDAFPPRNAYGDDAGWDLFAVDDTQVWNLRKGHRPHLTWIHTGIAVALPPGYYGRIVGRSSAASKGLHVIEGTIDAGYRGEQMARVVSLWAPESGHKVDNDYRIIKRGESVCQLIVQRCEPVTWVEVDDLMVGTRGLNGYGSSG